MLRHPLLKAAIRHRSAVQPSPSSRIPILISRTISSKRPGIPSSPLSSHPTNSSRNAASAASLSPRLSIPDVVSDDLPIVSIDRHKVAIGWDTRNWSRFHNIWLRDHCRCPNCFHPITKQRLYNTFDIPSDIAPIRAEARVDGLEVTWPSSDPHVSLYPWSWLQTNSYDPAFKLRQSFTDRKILWGSGIQQSPPIVTYEEVMNSDDRGLFKWLSNVDSFGFSFISGVPATPEATEELSQKIGFIRETHYGKFWDFTSDLAKGDTAYTTLALGAHTDNTYFVHRSCGLQLFHLLSHTDGSGGATLLVDGFYVASILNELNPEAYELLSKIPIPAHAAGELSALYRPSPPSGYPVRWNNDDRSVMNHLDGDVVEKWYDAIRAWYNYLTSPDSEYWVQLRPGMAVVVDNHRVLHGRSAFDGKRRMCGAYIGMDEYRSKLAVLNEKFAPDSVLRSTKHIPGVVDNGRNIWNNAL
ncbi:hypothetical protein BDQ17DRAFT_1359265 [Cyathus striatus]|nr:hypothetical protein BDQ17DRAFT_1359265 [Cyathus striatus]